MGGTIQTSTTKIPLRDLTREYQEIASDLHEAVDRVFARQNFILGTEVSALEASVTHKLGVGYAVGCASGSDALWLALKALGIGPGHAVVTTPFSFFATASAILRAGARPLFADIQPETFLLDHRKVREKLAASSIGKTEPRIRAVLAVHLYGQTVDWGQFEQLSKEFGEFGEFGTKDEPVALIEDAAQAFGARWGMRSAGALGNAAAFSFYPTKNLGAAGDAGMVTTNDEGVAERLRMLRAHGMRRRYVHEELGWNSRLDTLQAAVLNVKMRRIERWNQQRGDLAANYRTLFQNIGLVEPAPYPEKAIVLPTVQPEAGHVFHQYVIRASRRDELRSSLAEHGIGSEIYYPTPLHLQPALQRLGYQSGDLPESERAAKEVLALPMFPQLRNDEQEAVVAAIADFYSR